jgi:PAS domain S-box-containing protein
MSLFNEYFTNRISIIAVKICFTFLVGLVIFILDVSSELGVAGGVLYIIFVLMGLLYSNKSVTILLGVIALLLAILGFYLSPVGGEIWKVMLNRLYAVFIIIVSAVLVLFYKDSSRKIFQESEAKFKNLFNLTFEGILIHKKGIVVETNLSFEKMFGYSGEELQGKNITNILFPKKHHQLIFKNSIKNYSKPYKIEGIRKDGSIFPVEIESRFIKQGVENNLRVTAIRDISERVETEEALIKSEEKYRNIVENTSEWIYELDEKGVVTYSNSVVEQILGHKSVNLMGKNNFALIYKLDRARIAKIFLEKIKEKKGWKNLELRWAHKDGSYRYLESSAVPIINKEGILIGLRGVNRDITERKKTEDENKKLSTVVEQSANTIIITDINGRIEYVNSKFSEVSGYTSKEVLGKYPSILKSGKHTKEFYAELWKTIKSGGIWKGEFQNKTKNGNLHWEQTTITPIKNEEGGIISYLAIKEDVTIQKEAEKSLKKALNKAEESDKLKSAFLANMSHEIRTPMNGIIGFSEFLLEPNLSENKRTKYAGVVIDCSKQLLSIVNDILDISKIEAGIVQLYYESVNINKLLDELFVFYQLKAQEKKINFSYKKGLENNKSVIDIDKTKLNQVLTNLLSNAFKFTAEGNIEFGYQLVEDKLQFYIKDTGKGIDKKLKNKIFNRFFQEEIDLEKQYGGTGLGLSITKKFIELFKGEIWFNSSKQGTTMYFTIPYSKKKKQITSVIIEEKQGDFEVKNKELTVLVAEDQENNRMYINEVFSQANFKIIEAYNGKQAVELFKTHSEIDLVLMDIKMPIMNGVEAMKQLKKIKPSLPIIAISAFAMESDKQKALEQGFDSYLSKPIDKNLLFNTIDKHYLR